MFAKFSSTCPFCHQRIDTGSEITKRGSKYGHKVCPTSLPVSTTLSAKSLNSLRTAISTAPETTAVIEESAPVTLSDFTPSPLQAAIRDWMLNEDGNAAVQAVAGSGKTTTLVWLLQFTPANAKVAFCAFNKHIATELASRAPSHVTVGTLHSFGFSALRKAFGSKLEETSGDKLNKILNSYLPIPEDQPGFVRAEVRNKRNIVKRLVAISKATLNVSCSPHDLEYLSERYDVEVGEDAAELYPIVPMVMADCMAETSIIDFDDMLWLPVVLGVSLEQYDWLFVDEAQDLNNNQIQFVLRSLKSTGRAVVVGDRFQSLYGFRGADTEAIPNLVKALNAKELPLSICYRCPSSHIRLAQQIVPDIQARADASAGLVANVRQERVVAAAGDMIICRTNAPLVPMAFELIRKGIKATVRGRDIGKGLVDFVQKFKVDSLDTLDTMMREYLDREVARLSKREGKEMEIETLIDKYNTVVAVMSECTSVYQLTQKLSDLFSDKVEGVVLSSVHRAKGLQAARVFILKPELLPHPRAKEGWQMQQEMNCKYVALTRSTSELYFVED